MKRIKFAVIGCGHIGQRHASTILDNPNSELVALVEPRSIELSHNLSKVPRFNSLEELFASNIEIDTVNICTPNGLHSEQAIECLRNDLHVVIEKPMGLTADKCQEVINLSLEKGKRAFCVMQNRYSPPAIWLKDLVENNMLGKIHMVDVKCFWNRDSRYYKDDSESWRGSLDMDGGTLYTQFSHFIDLVYWLFGDFKDISARFNDFNHQKLTEFEDSGNVNFILQENALGSLSYSTSVIHSNFESSISIIAEKGTVKVGGQYMNKVEYCDIKDYEFKVLPPSNPPNNYGDYKGSANNHPFVIQNVVDVLNGKDVETTPARDGQKVVEIIERIYSHRKLNK
jgi:UDP-N-acetyl-2-amino-2-deoxyglucuronate dehydrogenase